MSWINNRPDDWNVGGGYEDEVDGLFVSDTCHLAFERGADAMLGKLKEAGTYIRGYGMGVSLTLGEKGWVVFIPDEER